MIDNQVSFFNIQGKSERSDIHTHVPDCENRVEITLTGDQHMQDDKEALATLLKLGIAEWLAQGRTIDLDTNEELPRLVPILCAYFSGDELAQLLGKKMAEDILAMYQTEMLQNLFLEHELQKVLHAFHEAHIPLILLKGSALAYTIYPRPHLRTFHDIDVLIHPQNLARANELFTGMGYAFYEEFRANTVDNSRTGYNYSKKHPESWLEVLVELHTAPHPSEIGTPFDVAMLWEKARSIEIHGETVLTMNPFDHLLYLCWHYRFHGFTRLLWLYDLVMVVRSIGTTIDWDELIQAARRQKLASTLYYCLTWCRSLFQVAIPDYVFARLRPPLVCRLIVERIAMPETAKALSVSSFQGRRMLARRIMVDSVGDLFKTGLRTLFPTRSTIGRRYMEHSRLPLQLFFVYYLIHPWLTLAKGGRHMVRHIGRRNTSV